MVTPFGADSIVALCIAVLALLVSGFISGSEIAFFSLTRTQCQELDEMPGGERTLRLLRNPERLLATILIGNNLVNVAIVMLVNFSLGPLFQGMPEVWSFILQTVILTFLILLFGEIFPKLYAGQRNLAWARAATGALTAMTRLFHPLSSVLVGGSSLVHRVVPRQADQVTTDDLSQALEMADVKEGDDREMLEGILKFGDTTAGEIMTPRVDVTGVDIDMDFAQVMEVVIDKGYARLPVYGDSMDDIKGVLYARDLLPHINKDDPRWDWRALMREPYYVPETRMIDDLLEDFRRRRVHLAIVIDEYGGTQGIVTLEDVLEEIVGDINDEYDEEEATYKRLPDDTYIFEGKTLLGDFFRVTGLDEDDYAPATSDCETLAGMLLAIKGDFPKEKESLVYGRCRFLVMTLARHRIEQVRVKVMPDVQPDQAVVKN